MTNITENCRTISESSNFGSKSDKREPYSRRSGLRFHGIEEKEGERTNAIMIAVVQKALGLSKIGPDQLKRSHRIGPKQDEQGSLHNSAVIIHFRSETVRDEVFRARVKLKERNGTHKDGQVFLHEDLTAKRAMIAFRTRQCRPRPLQNSKWNNHPDSQ